MIAPRILCTPRSEPEWGVAPGAAGRPPHPSRPEGGGQHEGDAFISSQYPGLGMANGASSLACLFSVLRALHESEELIEAAFPEKQQGAHCLSETGSGIGISSFSGAYRIELCAASPVLWRLAGESFHPG